jgi:hypothetical protein
MKYPFLEGSVELPDTSQNRTLHMLVLDPDTALSCSMIVSAFIEGESPAQFVDRQMKTLSKQLSKFKEMRRESVKIGNQNGANGSINALLLDTQFKQGDQAFYQKQCVALMEDNQHALILTINSNHPFGEKETAIWERAYKSITFNA